MTQARGYRSQMVLDFETTFNNDPASAAGLIMPYNTNGLEVAKPLNMPATITGTRNQVEPFVGNTGVSGTIVVPVDYIAFWYWLKAMFGAPDTTGSGTFTHTFTVGDSQPSFLIDKAFPDITKYWKYSGLKIASMNIPFGGDGELVATLNIIGANETPGTTAYDGSATEVSLGRLDNFEATLKEGGSTISNIKTVDLTIDLGLDDSQYVIGGGGIRGDIPEGLISISGNLTGLFENHDLVTKAVNSTESSLQITLTHNSYSLDIEIPELQLERAKTPIDGPRGVVQTLNYIGYYDDDADESSVIVVLINGDEHA